MTSGNIVIRKMANNDSDMRYEVSNVFVDGYYKDLSFFTKDREKLKVAFASTFNASVFYLAEIDGKIAGILACCDNQNRALRIQKAVMNKHLGFMMGSLAYRLLKNEFNTPLSYPDDTAYIESVTTIEAARGKGVGTALMQHVMQKLPYRQYILDVVDTNENAYRLYKKLGFDEFKRTREKHPKFKGFQYKIHMSWCKRKIGRRYYCNELQNYC